MYMIVHVYTVYVVNSLGWIFLPIIFVHAAGKISSHGLLPLTWTVSQSKLQSLFQAPASKPGWIQLPEVSVSVQSPEASLLGWIPSPACEQIQRVVGRP